VMRFILCFMLFWSCNVKCCAGKQWKRLQFYSRCWEPSICCSCFSHEMIAHQNWHIGSPMPYCSLRRLFPSSFVDFCLVYRLENCRISPPRFLSECRKTWKNKVYWVVLVNFTFSLFWSASVKWLAMKTAAASEMTWTVSEVKVK